MRFFSVCSFTLSTIASLVAAGENPIIYPAVNTVVQSGTTIEVTWTPTTSTSEKIDLVLRYGPTSNLLTGNPVACKPLRKLRCCLYALLFALYLHRTLAKPRLTSIPQRKFLTPAHTFGTFPPILATVNGPLPY